MPPVKNTAGPVQVVLPSPRTWAHIAQEDDHYSEVIVTLPNNGGRMKVAPLLD